MFRPSNKIIYASFFCFFTLILTGAFAFAHSGHTHEEKLRISLPDVVAKVNDQDIHNDDILRELKKTLKSFHVNDVNQDILDNGDADLLVMVHQDLALALKSNKLIKFTLNLIELGKLFSYNQINE